MLNMTANKTTVAEQLTILAQMYTFGWLSLALAQQASAKNKTKKNQAFVLTQQNLCSSSTILIICNKAVLKSV